jgi:hypothetical protein
MVSISTGILTRSDGCFEIDAFAAISLTPLICAPGMAVPPPTDQGSELNQKRPESTQLGRSGDTAKWPLLTHSGLQAQEFLLE